jgi:hypothetical protein
MVASANQLCIDVYDYSVMIRSDIPFGTLKAGKSRTATAGAKKGKFATRAVTPSPVRFWLAQEMEGKPINPTKIMPSESQGYILEIANLADTLQGILAMVNGERMQFAIRYASEPADVVVAFAATMPDVERAPLLKCIGQVSERILKGAGQANEPRKYPTPGRVAG